MKIFLVFAVAVITLLAASSSRKADNSSKKASVPTCCSKKKCIENKTEEIFSAHDFILLPTTPVTAFELNAVKDPVSMYLQDIYTVQANLTGIPAISIPNGLHSNGLPFGTQLMAPRFQEREMLVFSRYLQSIVN